MPVHFVIEDGEAIDGGGFGAEDEFSEGDWQGAAGGLDELDFGGGKVAFGSDPNARRARLAVMLFAEFLEIFAGMTAAGL